MRQGNSVYTGSPTFMTTTLSSSDHLYLYQNSSGMGDIYGQESPGWICCTLRSGLHEIPTMIRTIPHGLDNNHACKWISDNFPGMLICILFLENCLKSICMHAYSPIHVERSIFFLKYGTDLSPRFDTLNDLSTWIGE